MDLYVQAYELIRSVKNYWISYWFTQNFLGEDPRPPFQYNSARLSTIM